MLHRHPAVRLLSAVSLVVRAPNAWSVQGLTDLLRDKVIRTPLDPHITFADVSAE